MSDIELLPLPEAHVASMAQFKEYHWRAYTAEQMRAYAVAERKGIVDALQAAIMNGELPAACEDAVDWLERRTKVEK